MAKLYTLDGKLLVGTPEVRIGDICYPVDNRADNVKKLMKELNKVHSEVNEEKVLNTDELIIKAAFSNKAAEILKMELSYEAQQQLAKIAMSAMTGEELEDEEPRFQEEK